MGRKYWAIVAKDIRLEFRGKDIWVTMAAFVVMVALLFGLAIDPYTTRLKPVFPGILWLSFLFAGMLAVGRGFEHETENEALLGLMVAPGDRLAIFAAKLTTAFVFMFTVDLVLSPVVFAFLNEPFSGSLVDYILVLALGSVGFVSVGTLFGAMAAQTRAAHVLIPVMLAPFAGPVVIFGVEATSAILRSGGAGAAPWPWVYALIAFDVVFLALPLLLYEYVWEV
jgi:heme exporter protein B